MKQLSGRGGGFFVGGKRMRGFMGPFEGPGPYFDGPGGPLGPEFYPPPGSGRFPGDFFPGGPPPGMFSPGEDSFCPHCQSIFVLDAFSTTQDHRSELMVS